MIATLRDLRNTKGYSFSKDCSPSFIFCVSCYTWLFLLLKMQVASSHIVTSFSLFPELYQLFFQRMRLFIINPLKKSAFSSFVKDQNNKHLCLFIPIYGTVTEIRHCLELIVCNLTLIPQPRKLPLLLPCEAISQTQFLHGNS